VPNTYWNWGLTAVLIALLSPRPALPQTTIPVPQAAGLLVGDLNEDGKPDLVIGQNSASGFGVYVYLGKGDGTFSGPVVTSIPGADIQAIFDYDGDGKPDLILSGGNLSFVALGNGDGTFRAGQSDLIGLGGWFNAVADFNGDGKPDLLIAPGGSHGGENTFSPFAILFNNGNGKFTQKLLPPSSVPLSPPIPGGIIAIGDVNLDGKADIVTTSGVFLSNGDGTFQSVPWSDPDEGVGFGQNLGSAIADVNGDGNPDIIYVSALSGPAVVVLFGNGDGTFRLGDFYVLGGAGSYQSLVVADFDLDGAPDIAVSSAPTTPGESVAGLTILQNYGDGTFRNAISVSGLSLGTNEPELGVPVSVSDFNGDGKPDLALLAAPAASATAPSTSAVASVLLNGARIQFPVLLGGIVNAASGANGGLSPGSLASLYMLPQPFQPVNASHLPLPTNLDGVTLLIVGQVPLLAVTPTQINFQVPWDLFPGESSGLFTLVTPAQSYPSPWGIDLTQFSPGIFTMNAQGKGQGAIVIANSSTVAAQTGSFPGSRPVAHGEYVSIFCTGLGPVTNQPANGAPALSSPLSRTLSAPTVTIGGVPATVEFSGLAPGSVGVDQVNVQVPATAPSGAQVLVIIRTADGSVSNTVTMAIQ
jgi:uncharacterized protein (TIGR03437 family)